jgi:hypothetical protein
MSHPLLHKALCAGLLISTLGAVSGCVVQPAPAYPAYYAPAPVYVGPSVYYGPRYHPYWHGPYHRWH